MFQVSNMIHCDSPSHLTSIPLSSRSETRPTGAQAVRGGPGAHSVMQRVRVPQPTLSTPAGAGLSLGQRSPGALRDAGLILDASVLSCGAATSPVHA